MRRNDAVKPVAHRKDPTNTGNNRTPGARATPARGSNVVHWGPWRAILLTASMLVIVLSIFQILIPSRVSPYWSTEVAVVCVLWGGCYLLCSYAQFQTLYLFTSAFILPLCLFHLGITIPYGFGWLKDDQWTNSSLAPWLQLAGWYVALTLGCIGLGFALSLKRARFRRDRLAVAPEVARDTAATAFQDGIGFLLASGVFLGMAIYSFGNLLAYSRVQFFAGVGDTRGLGVFMMVFPTASILLVIGARTSFQKLLAGGTALFAFLFFLFSGYRSWAFFPALVGVVLWVKNGRKIPIWLASLAVVLVLFAIPVAGMLRNMGPYDKLNQSDLDTSVKHTSIDKALLEMGQTAGILANVLRLIPATESYRYGMTYFEALRNSIPNVMPKMQASQRKKAEEKAMFDPSAINEMIPSDWLTYRLEPNKFDEGQGVGFSAIGEPYMNFGLPGVVVFFIFLGWVLGRLDAVNLRTRPNLMVLSAIAIWPLLTLVRNDFGNFSKPVTFMLITLGIWRYAMRFVSRRRLRRHGVRSANVQ